MPSLGLGGSLSKSGKIGSSVITAGRTLWAPFDSTSPLNKNQVDSWTLESNWTESGTSLSHTGTATERAFDSNLTPGLVQGTIYEVSYSITEYTSGSVRIDCGTGGVGIVRSAVGSYKEHLKCTTNSTLFLNNNASSPRQFIGTVDNISVKLVSSYTGQGLEFDGVSDYITMPNTGGGYTELTLSAWVKKTIGNAGSIFGHEGGGSYFRWTNPTNLHLYINGTAADISFNDGASFIEDGEWHYYVATYNGATGAKIYIDGQLGTSQSLVTSQITSAKGFGNVGSYNGINTPSHYLDGSMSNAQIWNKEFSADDVSYAYANPEKLALGNSGTSLTYSNLKLWYPMQDGDRGNQYNDTNSKSYLLDGAGTGLGDEATNLDNFGSDVGAVRVGDTIVFDNIASSGAETQITSVDITVGELYNITYTISNYSGSGYIRLSVGHETTTNKLSNGTYTEYVRYATGLDRTYFYVGGSTFSGTISNVSVKAVNDKNHGTSLFYGDESWANDEALLSTDYGSELNPNPTFANWTGTVPNGWTVSGDDGGSNTIAQGPNNGLDIVSDGNTAIYAQLADVTVIGRTYAFTVTIADLTDDDLSFNTGGTRFFDLSGATYGVGTHSGTFTAEDTYVRIIRIGSCNAEITAFSLKELGSTSELRNGSAEIASGALTYNKWYEITARDGIDFTTYGAPDNNIGTKFLVSHADGSSVPTMDSNDKVWLLDLGWGGYAGNAYSIVEEEDALRLKVTMGSTVANGLYIYFNSANTEFSTTFVIGRAYNFTCKLKVSSGDDVNGYLYNGTTGTGVTYTNNSFATINLTFTAKSATGAYFKLQSLSDGDEVWISDFTIKEVGFATGWTDADAQPTIPQLGFQSYNQLAWFDGTADYISVANNSAIDVGTGDFSISCWVITSAVSSNTFLVDRNHVTAYSIYIVPGGGLKIAIHATYLSISGHDIDDSKWHHVVASYARSGSLNVYVDGVLAGTSDISNDNENLNNGQVLTIGKSVSSGGYLNGCMTEVSLWKGEALTTAKVQELYNDGEALDALTHSSKTNLKGYWRNEGDSEWTDLSIDGAGASNGNHGGPQSIAEHLILPEGQNSRDTQGFLMNRVRTSGINNGVKNDGGHRHSYIDSGHSTIAAGTDFTIGFWAKTFSFTASNVMGASGTDYVSLSNDSGDGKLVIEMSNNAFGETFPAVDTTTGIGQWYYWTITRGELANNQLRFYLNGAINATGGEVTAHPAAHDLDLRYLGVHAPTGSPFMGQLDDIVVYNSTALKPAQVLRNYKAGKGRHRN